MVTSNRRPFISQSIKYFQRQDYPNKELIILDEGDDKIEDIIPNEDNIHYFYSEKINLGELRNKAISKAKGEIIITWDDDDWYGEKRITHQISPLIKKEADLTCIGSSIVYDLSDDKFWSKSSKTGNLLPHRGTLCYQKQLWDELIKYPPLVVGEDKKFLNDCIKEGLKLKIIANQGDIVSIVHYTNTTSRIFVDHTNFSWKEIKIPDFFLGDFQFYKNLMQRQQNEMKLMIKDMKERHLNESLLLKEEKQNLVLRLKKIREKNEELTLANQNLRKKIGELNEQLQGKNSEIEK